MEQKALHKLIHVAFIFVGKRKRWLFLRLTDDKKYCWFEQRGDGKEISTSFESQKCEEAIQMAWYNWKSQNISMLMCGFRYTLPERDEHGMNALFHQMVASYSTPNGIYFDSDAGFNCIVHNASQGALALWRNLQKQKLL